MHGFSGSGKSFVAQEIAKNTSSIILRADAIRKHLTNTPFNVSNPNIYDDDTSKKVYAYLFDNAVSLTSLGLNVVVDATYLKPTQRQQALFGLLSKGIKTKVMSVQVDEEIALERIRQRKGDVSDANDTILQMQLSHFEEIADSEQQHVIVCDNNIKFQFQQIAQYL